MQTHFLRPFASRAVMACALGAGAVQAGIPVVDPGNLALNRQSALEAMAQTAKQIEQYNTQLEQFKIMQKNAALPTSYIWDQATQTISRLRATLDTLEQYKQQAGGLEASLQQFKDVQGHRASACVSGTCTPAQWSQRMQEQAQRGSQVQKGANDALLRALDQQHQAMQTDAQQLQRLQTEAQGAGGQMQALAAANQLASHQAHQLQQIRALLVAQQTAVATRQQVLADREALAQASQEQVLAPRMGRTPNPLNWSSVKP